MKSKLVSVLAAAGALAFAAAATAYRGAIPALSGNKGAELPIIMYHSVLKDTELSGKYVITPDTLRRDIDYLYNHGYTTVSAAEVLDFIDGKAELPEKPVMLTFDDGCYNNYGYVLPILEEKNAHGIFSIVGSYTDSYSSSGEANLTYGYMRWSDVREMLKSPCAEVACHSYAFHTNSGGRSGAGRAKNESARDYKKAFRSDTERFGKRCAEETGFSPVIYTYPFGAYDKESLEVLSAMGYRITLSCEEGMNYITGDASCASLMKRYNRPSGISSEEYFRAVLHGVK